MTTHAPCVETCDIICDFRVYSWGWGVHGQLGQGDVEDRNRPTLVAGLQGLEVVSIAAGYAHTVVATKDVSRRRMKMFKTLQSHSSIYFQLVKLLNCVELLLFNLFNCF